MDDAEAYQYEALSIASGMEIRLLKIDDGHADSTLRLRLLTVELNSTTPQYDALSYMWGSKDNVQIAFVDNKSVRVRENLSSFLKHYRDTIPGGHKDSYLWIDALCINQEDSGEKEWQVKFIKARSVLIWLGDISQHAPSVTQFEAFLEQPFGSKRDTKSVPGPAHHPQQEQHQVSIDADEALHPIEMHASQIIQSPYWGRLWIVQEIKLAANASIICGCELLPLACMTRLKTHVGSGLFNLSRHISSKQLELFRLATSKHEDTHTWAHYVVEYRNHQCSELQDHVFGMLGLADERFEDLPMPYGDALGYTMLGVLEHSIDQHKHQGEEHDTLAIMHDLSTVLLVGTNDLLAASQYRGPRNGKSFILAFKDVIEIFSEPSPPQFTDSDGVPLHFPPSHGAMWIFACESVAMHTDGSGPYLCFGRRHASVRWYPKSTSGSIQNTVSEVEDLAMRPKIMYLRHWRSSPSTNAARSWMKAKQTDELGCGLEGAQEAQQSKHFYLPCSFLALTELYAAFRTLAGLPD
ncbi:hypothetical protein LTS10_010177 [Elasticomyces elasticus]|nr:hypothetical protein LTS10_010177 [Elasticomyces elasticus]